MGEYNRSPVVLSTCLMAEVPSVTFPGDSGRFAGVFIHVLPCPIFIPMRDQAHWLRRGYQARPRPPSIAGTAAMLAAGSAGTPSGRELHDRKYPHLLRRPGERIKLVWLEMG
jgi:hypothetical protein